jgi:hypothetical protein
MKGMNCEYFKKRVVGCWRILVFSSIVYTHSSDILNMVDPSLRAWGLYCIVHFRLGELL